MFREKMSMRWLVLGCFLLGLSASGCQTDAFCFVCYRDKDAGPISGGSDGQVIFIPPSTDSGAKPPPSDAGSHPACNADTTSDPDNCGSCGNVCSYPGAYGKCVDGKCEFDRCADGLVDVNKDPKDGCECTITNGGTEICDQIDNDCNGKVDEGFDLQTDVNNCGACNTACPDLPHSTVACVKGKCDYTCEGGYENLGQQGVGCPYQCPVSPPIPETCNGVDDDCDGIIDDGDPGAGVPCEDNCPNGKCQGECQPGTTVCTGTKDGIACVGGTRPTVEVCDGKDNDCDGITDNGFDLVNDPLNCGACGVQCKSGTKCVNGFCDFKCDANQRDLDGNPANGCEYTCPVFPIQPEICDGIDQNCDGIVDNGATDVGKACTGNCPAPDACVKSGSCAPYKISPANGSCYGVCSANGVTACPSGIIVCKYSTERVDELCNGLDDNCDGRIDEGFDLQNDPSNCGSCGNVCTATNATARTCKNGVCGAIEVCAPGYKDMNGNPADGCEYKCPVYPPVGESCNGIDDDCNGVKDDNITGLGAMCTSNCPTPNACVAAGNCTTAVSSQTNGCYGVCATDGRTSCAAGSTVCTHIGAAAETCNGVDDNCDGRIDEGFNTATDVNNCGGCGIVCSLPGAATVKCTAGVCQVNTCTAGRADVDKNPANGCEYACPVYPTKAETCNGVDDNCDGIIDNNPTDVGTACSDNCPGGVCKGICTTGTTACVSGKKVCQGGGGVQLEVCNNKDDDCDGTVDNGFNKQTDPLNCGTCGNACNLANTSVNGCAGGACKVTQCDPGFADVDGNPANGCEYTCPVYPTRTEICNGVDDDCDGKVDTADSSLVTPSNFCVQTGPCSGSKPVCNALNGTTAWHCNYSSDVEVTSTGAVAVSESRCDGKDNNCNGQADESFPLKGQPCTVGKGICAGSSTYACTTDLTGVECPATATATNAVDEDCNGLDDDCDGVVDERTPVTGSKCYNGGQHNCVGWVDPMVKVGTSTWIYSYEASRPDSSSSSAGTTATRACSKGNKIPWSSVNYSEAVAACAAVKDGAGNPMRLCTEAEWQTACQDNNSSNLWSYSTSPGTYVAGKCNDNASVNPGAPWPTGKTGAGADNTCYANWGGLNRVYDMSGNLSEWTSTTATSNGNTYQRVRGGNYQTFPNGTRCDFGFVLQLPTFQNFDLGFRCCSGAAP